MFDFLNEYPDMVNANEAAEILSCSPKTVSKLCREGKLRAMKVGKSWSIPLMALKDFILLQTHYITDYKA